MGVIKLRAVVVNEQHQGESDKRLSLLSKEMGKVSVLAKGARKPRSKYVAGSQLFTYADFVVFSGNGFYSVTQIDIIEGFYKIREDFQRLCYGAYILEIIHKTVYENSPNDSIMLLLLKTLQAINGEGAELDLVARAFEFKYMQLSGYQPELHCCSHCGGAVDQGFSFGIEGLVCRQCALNYQQKAAVSLPVVQAINYILGQDLKQLFRFQLDYQYRAELDKAAALFMNNLDVELKSRDFLKNI